MAIGYVILPVAVMIVENLIALATFFASEITRSIIQATVCLVEV